MLGRVMATGVVVFWITMMAALVRMEYWPAAGPVSEVPLELVLRKVFAREVTNLRIYHEDRDIGICRIDISPLHAAAGGEPSSAPPQRSSWLVHTDLKLAVALLNLPSRLSVEGDTVFNSRYQVESFRLHSTLAEGRIDVRGDAASRRLQVDFAFGDRREQRVFDFQQIQGAGLAGVLGLPGLGALGGLGASSDPGGAGGSAAPAPQTTVTMGTLPVTGAKQKAYVVRTRINDGLWADLWVSQQGDILLARTSLGVTMLSNLYEYDTLERPATRRGSER